MIVNGKATRSIWFDKGAGCVKIIDQRWLPHDLPIVELRYREDFIAAIRDMWVRGAPLIGATAAYGVATQMVLDPSDKSLLETCELLQATRPTAINLRWALDEMKDLLEPLNERERAAIAFERAGQICDEDVECNRKIGVFGLELIRELSIDKPLGEPVNILTHCNAGWLATVDWGTATSPIYHAHNENIPVHVYVDETRPRNQGAHLTAFELGQEGIDHQLIVDNAGGHLMQHAKVDMVIVGTDRTAANGDVCNKIGTYLKALAARDNGIPFYVALPSSTIDWTIDNGISDIPIEERDGIEVTKIWGKLDDGTVSRVQISPDDTPVANPAFDVTPAHLVTGLITERGVCEASREGLLELFPERRNALEEE